ncbi:MAG: hypothetical protein WDO68_23220 [Gammaproteobacteria bacterium]
MAANPLIAFRVPPETKASLHALAQSRNLTDSALLQKLVEMALLQHVGVTQSAVTVPVQQISRGTRLCVRLRPEDHLLLQERANGRGLAAATYASMLLRAHLHAMSPLPDRELAELKRAVAALGLIGRSLSHVARVADQSGTGSGPSVGDMRAILRALEGLRDHVKALMLANVRAWESRHDEAGR